MSNNPIIPLPTDSVSAELGAEFDLEGYSSSSLSAMGAYMFDIASGKVDYGLTDNQPALYLILIPCLLLVCFRNCFMLTALNSRSALSCPAQPRVPLMSVPLLDN